MKNSLRVAWRWWVFIVIGLCLAACTADDEISAEVCPSRYLPKIDGRCEPGSSPHGNGCCQPAGLPVEMPCPPGAQLNEAGTCCPAGTISLEDGSCQLAGIPPSQCGEGFVHDGDVGCEPILPPEDCPEGMMAVPGESECHVVAPCGEGTWGDIAVEPNTEYVDSSYDGSAGPSEGSPTRPWTTIGDGISAADPGAIVAVATGTYVENVQIAGKPVRLWGRCPSNVEVIGANSNANTINILNTATSGTEILNISVTGGYQGINILGAKNITIKQVRVHDVPGWGITALNHQGPAQITVKDSLIEQNQEIGLQIEGSSALIEGVVVRDTSQNTLGYFGRGIQLLASLYTGERSTVTLTNSLIERNHDINVQVEGSSVTIEGVVARNSIPNSNGYGGRGINVQYNLTTEEPADVTINGSLIERNWEVGLFVAGSDVSIEGAVVRDTLLSNGEFGHGISVISGPKKAQRSYVTLNDSLVERNSVAGMFIEGSDATIRGVVVRDTLPDSHGQLGLGIIDTDGSSVNLIGSLVERNRDMGVLVDSSHATIESVVVRDTSPTNHGQSGRGISVQPKLNTPDRSNVTLKSSLVERNHDVGLFISGSDVAIEGVVVRDTLPDEHGLFGRGVTIQARSDAGRANVTMMSSIVERNHQAGIIIAGSDTTIEGVVVRDTLPDKDGEAGRGIHIQHDVSSGERSNVAINSVLIEHSWWTGLVATGADISVEGVIVRGTLADESGKFGDGIAVFTFDFPTIVHIKNTQVDSNGRAGISNFGSQVTLDKVELSCNRVDINGEPHQGHDFVFPSLGDSLCGCPEGSKPFKECRVVSADLEPPSLLEQAEPNGS